MPRDYVMCAHGSNHTDHQRTTNKLLSVQRVPAPRLKLLSPRPLLSDMLFGQDISPEELTDEMDDE